MSLFFALNASHVFGMILWVSAQLFLMILTPNFETSLLFVTRHLTLFTHSYICTVTLRCLMAHTITFKTQFFGTFKWIVAIFTTEDAIETNALIGTILLEVTELFTVATFKCGVIIEVVPSNLWFKLLELILIRWKTTAFVGLIFLRGLLIFRNGALLFFWFFKLDFCFKIGVAS